ncbi:hypothetical protein Btru_029709 [Bulinus truncatus]|nr:hypothetical protein Btru_029709 [Bulinus truncatus]
MGKIYGEASARWVDTFDRMVGHSGSVQYRQKGRSQWVDTFDRRVGHSGLIHLTEGSVTVAKNCTSLIKRVDRSRSGSGQAGQTVWDRLRSDSLLGALRQQRLGRSWMKASGAASLSIEGAKRIIHWDA